MVRPANQIQFRVTSNLLATEQLSFHDFAKEFTGELSEHHIGDPLGESANGTRRIHTQSAWHNRAVRHV